MQSYAKTDVGLLRRENQDFIYASDERVGILPNLYIVADGMGGHNAGDFASRFCVEKFTELIKAAPSDSPSVISVIEDALRETNEQLIIKAAEGPDYEGMGTTFVMATVDEQGIMKAANIGDSRLYLIGDGITQITQDHSLVAEMVKNGEIKNEEARFHPKKNIVTRAISASCVVIPDMFEVALKPGDTVLLCSDGLSNMLSDNEIFAHVNKNRDSLEKAAEELISAANDNGGRDNISVVMFKI